MGTDREIPILKNSCRVHYHTLDRVYSLLPSLSFLLLVSNTLVNTEIDCN